MKLIDNQLAALSLSLDRRAPATLTHQLYVQLRDLILAQRLGPGAKLPSTRALASELGVSRTTPLSAYDQLLAEGYIRARRGSGLYVESLTAAQPPQTPATPEAAPPPAPPLRARPFDLSGQDVARFPHAAWARALSQGWRRWGKDAADPVDPLGLPALRSAVADYILALRGVRYAADQILITTSAADAAGLIAQCLKRRLDRPVQAWVEDPGYVAARRALTQAGANIVAVPVDAHGLQVETGRQRAPDADMVLITPSRQFPLGAPLSLPRRLELIAWARSCGAVIVEDEFDSEVRFTGRPLASLASLDPGGQVLALGSFSKLTFPGLRLGYIAGPPSLIADLRAERLAQGVVLPLSAQPALASFIASGDLSRHVRHLRRRLIQRRAVLLDALQQHLSHALIVQPQEVGMHMTARLTQERSERMTDVEVCARAAESGVSVRPLSRFYQAPPGEPGLIFGYAAWDDAEIRAGVAALAEVIRA